MGSEMCIRDRDVIVTQTVQHTMATLMPRKVLERAKRYLRRECRKPHDVGVRAYAHHLLRVGRQELGKLPPYGPAQALNDGELAEILTYGIPKSWNREMDRQGFDSVVKTYAEVVEFLEGIEAAEDPGAKLPSKPKNKNSSAKSNGSGKKFCLIHGHGNHSSDECHKLQSEAKRIKSGDFKSSGGKGNFTKKSWKKKADDSNNKSKKDLTAFVKKQICLLYTSPSPRDS